jgi:hypothetical protein
MARFTEVAAADKRVKALLKALRQGAYHIDLEGLEREIDSLHLTRMIRTLKTEEVITSFQKKFITAALQHQAFRSRLVEIKVKCFRVGARLEEHIGVVRSYLGITYPNSLSKYRTVAERKAAINTILEEPMTFLSKLALKDKELEQIIKDLDQTSFSLKHIMDAMQINHVDKSSKF